MAIDNKQETSKQEEWIEVDVKSLSEELGSRDWERTTKDIPYDEVYEQVGEKSIPRESYATLFWSLVQQYYHMIKTFTKSDRDEETV